MCSSSSFASTFLLTNSPSILPRRYVSSTNSHLFITNLRPTYSSLPLRLSASLTDRDLQISSWFRPYNPNDNDYNGWVFINSPIDDTKPPKRGLSRLVIGVVGTSIAVLFASVAYVSLSRRGFKFQFCSPLRSLDGIFSRTETEGDRGKTDEYNLENDEVANESAAESIPDSKIDAVTSASVNKLERVIITVPVDSTQEEALLVLKKLKIIEDDIEARELCTRREYARWLVHLYSSLERSPKHHIIPSVSLSGSTIAAFDDISFEDPDFESIQALAESGIIPSKLSPNSDSEYDGLEAREKNYFFPERFVSRQTLINWKAQLDYELVLGILERSRYQVQRWVLWT